MKVWRATRNAGNNPQEISDRATRQLGAAAGLQAVPRFFLILVCRVQIFSIFSLRIGPRPCYQQLLMQLPEAIRLAVLSALCRPWISLALLTSQI